MQRVSATLGVVVKDRLGVVRKVNTEKHVLFRTCSRMRYEAGLRAPRPDPGARNIVFLQIQQHAFRIF